MVGIFNNKVLCSYYFLEIFVGERGYDGGEESRYRWDAPSPPPLGKTLPSVEKSQSLVHGDLYNQKESMIF